MSNTQRQNGTPENVVKQPVFLPNTDIWETKDQLVMFAEIPGADPESVDVSVDRDVLRVSARSRMTAPSGYSPIHTEYRDGDYHRSLPIRLTQTPTTCWVRPIAGVEFSVGRRLSPARDPQQ